MTHLAALQHSEWIPWDIQKPPEGALVKFWDEKDHLQWVGTSYDVQMVSTDYLWWKLTGIAKESK